METIFSKIIKGDIPCYKIDEDDNSFAFLDINPLAKGHTLVVPKNPVDYIFDLPNDDYQQLWLFAKKIGLAINRVIPCNRVGVTVIGLEVPHAHIHLIPINSITDMEFSREKLKFTDEQFRKTAELIRSNL